MNKKLTLTIEQSLIEQAKEYARSKDRSLSDIVENYFQLLIKENSSKNRISAPLTQSLKGSFTAPEKFDYKKELENSLSEKYL